MNNQNINQTIRKIFAKISFLAVALLIVSGFSFIVHAEDSPITIKIAPLKYEEKVNPSDIKEGFLSVANPTDKAQKIVVETSNFKMKGVDGDLDFYGDTAEQDEFTDFVELQTKEFTLGAQEGRRVSFKIRMPDSSSGGYYGVIFFKSVSDTTSDKTVTNVSPRVGTLFLLEAGEGKKDGKVENLAQTEGLFNKKVNVTFDFLNLAGYNDFPRGSYLKPSGKIIVQNIWGKEIYSKNIEGMYVLPQNKREISADFENPYMFGIYKAKVKLSKFPGSGEETTEKSFIKASPYIIIALIATVDLLLLLIIIQMKIKKKKRKDKKVAG